MGSIYPKKVASFAYFARHSPERQDMDLVSRL